MTSVEIAFSSIVFDESEGKETEFQLIKKSYGREAYFVARKPKLSHPHSPNLRGERKEANSQVLFKPFSSLRVKENISNRILYHVVVTASERKNPMKAYGRCGSYMKLHRGILFYFYYYGQFHMNASKLQAAVGTGTTPPVKTAVPSRPDPTPNATGRAGRSRGGEHRDLSPCHRALQWLLHFEGPLPPAPTRQRWEEAARSGRDRERAARANKESGAVLRVRRRRARALWFRSIPGAIKQENRKALREQARFLLVVTGSARSACVLAERARYCSDGEGRTT
ncbi:hypothetical protein Anapl_01469 [Anas platyrhynchos]|uniref:Uncharacterized protein n=1 Tax=Anas platyrhynchos TaxID=8839 RepID=R0LRB4_ANAPL|nr:hypothetical protein Anapl_01469 [Anas platyrhynchos]